MPAQRKFETKQEVKLDPKVHPDGKGVIVGHRWGPQEHSGHRSLGWQYYVKVRSAESWPIVTEEDLLKWQEETNEGSIQSELP